MFVSADRSEDELKAYMAEAHGNWCVIPHGDESNEKLNEKYGVQGIPTLTIVKPNGDAVVEDAVEDVAESGKTPKALFEEWKALCAL